MREILFRGKRIDNGEWVYGYVFDDGMADNKQVFVGGLTVSDAKWNTCDRYEVGLDFEEVDPATIGQYTGLTNKNGVKIFEGDICKSSLDLLFVVIWDEENARFLGFTIERERRLIYVGREPKVEIIGNIHDNPDLLTCCDNS